MAFSIFDLKKAISKYNQDANGNKKINKDDHFGFQVLSTKSLQILMDANEQLKNAPKLFSKLSGKGKNDFKRDFLSAINNRDAKKFKENIALFREDVQKNRNQKWYEEEQRRLRMPGFWNELVEKFAAQFRVAIQGLHHRWQKHQDYSHYNSLALKHVSEDILSVFDNYLELAQLELSQKEKQLPLSIAHAFKQYLNQLQNELITARRSLCWAMLARLEVASKKDDLQAEDVTVGLAKVLQKMGVLKRTAQFPEEQRNLTPDCFQYFHRFIEEHGTPQVKNRLKHLAWFREDSDFVTVKRGKYHLLVPKVLSDFIPERSPKIVALFSGSHFRYQFFIDRLALMSRIRWLPKQPESVTSLKELMTHPSLKYFNELEKELSREYENSKNQFRTGLLTPILHRTTKHFQDAWQDFLLHQLKNILDKKIKWMHQVSLQIQTRLDLGIETELLESIDFKQDLKLLIENIEQLCHTLKVDPQALPELMNVKNIVIDVMEFNQSPSGLQEISLEEATQHCPAIIQEPNLDEVPNDTVNALEEANNFLQACKDLDLFDQLKSDVNFMVKFEQAVVEIKKSLDSDLKTDLKATVEQYFAQYLTACLKFNDPLNDASIKRWPSIENFFLNVASKDIRTRTTTLQELASKNQGFLWQIKCRSYLTSYETKIEAVLPVRKAANKKLYSENHSPTFFTHVLRARVVPLKEELQHSPIQDCQQRGSK